MILVYIYIALRSDFYVVAKLSINLHALFMGTLTSFLVDRILLLKNMNGSPDFVGMTFKEEMGASY